jgi:uncharacterized protein YeaO (DUF488 family)
MNVQIKRVYEKSDPKDGFRILVDRLWPRGMTKEKAAVDLWLKDIAPSTELRKEFGHNPGKWQEFQKKYLKELKENQEAVNELKEHLKKSDVTLLYAAKDEAHNEALIIKDFLS